MALLLQMLTWVITTIVDLLTKAIFQGAAFVVVAAIQVLKGPGQAVGFILDQLNDFIPTVTGYFTDMAKEAVSSLLSTCFDIVKEGISGTISLATSGATDMADQMKGGFDFLVEQGQEVVAAISEMVGSVVESIWNNYVEAVGYVMEKVQES
ncbi:hypothetical protein AMTRI_Chr06g172910 [Amborella trichopoda]|uniref:Uncharacterized protein n=1 Tax=Amborella trichopoda TaxID=13333 RepID=W1PQV3_AMBTC|nr:hypothetical protein AMTR_s00013p00260440 [Amborella trichopoda]